MVGHGWGSNCGNRNSRLAALMLIACDWGSQRYIKAALELQVKEYSRWETN
jgi:hypothetical protein